MQYFSAESGRSRSAVAAPLSLVSSPVIKSSPQRDASIADLVAWSDRLSTLATVVRAAGLDSVLSACGAMTLLAPTDEAFAQLPEGQLDALMRSGQRDELQSLLLGHITPGRIASAQLCEVDRLMTPRGTSVPVQAGREGLTVGGAAILWADVAAANGVIHIIDRVLVPAPEKLYVV